MNCLPLGGTDFVNDKKEVKRIIMRWYRAEIQVTVRGWKLVRSYVIEVSDANETKEKKRINKWYRVCGVGSSGRSFKR